MVIFLDRNSSSLHPPSCPPMYFSSPLALFLLLKCLAAGTPGYRPGAQCSGARPAHGACSLVLAPAPLRTGFRGAAFEAALTNLNTPKEGFNFDCREGKKKVGSGARTVFVEL